MSARARDLKRLRRHVRAAERQPSVVSAHGYLDGRYPRVMIMRRFQARQTPAGGRPFIGVAIPEPVGNYYGFVQVKK